jgi:hypothetical protein
MLESLAFVFPNSQIHWLIVITIVLLLFGSRLPSVLLAVERSAGELRIRNPALWRRLVLHAAAREEKERQFIRGLRRWLSSKTTPVILAAALGLLLFLLSR